MMKNSSISSSQMVNEFDAKPIESKSGNKMLTRLQRVLGIVKGNADMLLKNTKKIQISAPAAIANTLGSFSIKLETNPPMLPTVAYFA